MRDVDVAWLAGIFEGEGCMEVGRNGMTRVSINMTDRDVIERVQALVPCPRIGVREATNPRHKTGYTWRLSGHARVKGVLELLLPWFGERRRTRALEVLQHIESSVGVGGAWKARGVCKNGHPRNEENTMMRAETRNGVSKEYRRCRPCQHAADKRSNDKRATKNRGQVISA